MVNPFFVEIEANLTITVHVCTEFLCFCALKNPEIRNHLMLNQSSHLTSLTYLPDFPDFLKFTIKNPEIINCHSGYLTSLISVPDFLTFTRLDQSGHHPNFLATSVNFSVHPVHTKAVDRFRYISGRNSKALSVGTKVAN